MYLEEGVRQHKEKDNDKKLVNTNVLTNTQTLNF